ncbi:putative ABC transporter permease [Stigmatella aurantiaca]|uniref:ABC-transporter type IV n=1 Tax=Stigmatella aurantiaca (strain DW4/3-1) TaxID=378806 RepID=Q098K6_STIAD|nr:putative ABC transporter permease [Stigmatella aurantiaca]ADO68132.1 uncharacterized protein STAUR_0323 [Stigmatella aurantiaca DW4/3-1]EAU68114.1 hypothetical protein STIAU_2678 [Stigmatella aurantiaca DW4/3-1]
MSGGRSERQRPLGSEGQPLGTFARFVVYGLMGWCIECLFTSLVDLATGAGDLRLRGYSYLWMHPIWGVGLLLGEQLVGVMKRAGLSRLLRATLGMVLCFAVEYLTGAGLVAVLGLCPWDYSAAWASVNGLIRLDYAPYWFMCALMCEFIFALVGRVQLGGGAAWAHSPHSPTEPPASLPASL